MAVKRKIMSPVGIIDSKRNIGIDIIRILAMILVIANHIEPRPFESNAVQYAMFYPIMKTNNTLFFMISGFLNIDKIFKTSNDYKKFFTDRFINVAFPFFAVAIVYYLIKSILYSSPISFGGIWYWFNDEIATTTHLWFVCTLLGCILSTPFISKAVHSMSNKELNTVLCVGIFWIIFSEPLSANLGFSFGLRGWIFTGSIFEYFFGYCYRRLISNSNWKKCIYIGLAAYLISAIDRFCTHKYGFTYLSCSAYGMLMSAGIISVCLFGTSINNSYVLRGIKFFSKYSYYIYLLHWYVITKIVPFFVISVKNEWAMYIQRLLITTMISLIVSILSSNLFFNPAKAILKKLLYRFIY